MTDQARITKPVVVAFPGEFDISNAGDLAKQMRAAITVGLDQVLPTYPSLDRALAGEPIPR